MRAPLWHLRNGFWRWWYAGPRWTRWGILAVGLAIDGTLAIGGTLAAGWPGYWGAIA